MYGVIRKSGPFGKKVSSRVRLELLVYTQTKKQINRLTVFLFAKEFACDEHVIIGQSEMFFFSDSSNG